MSISTFLIGSTKSFSQHHVKKTYVAVVRGFIEEDK